MPLIYLSKELYDQLVRMHKEPSEFVNKAVSEKLRKRKRPQKRISEFANKAVREKLENVKDVK